MAYFFSNWEKQVYLQNSKRNKSKPCSWCWSTVSSKYLITKKEFLFCVRFNETWGQVNDPWTEEFDVKCFCRGCIEKKGLFLSWSAVSQVLSLWPSLYCKDQIVIGEGLRVVMNKLEDRFVIRHNVLQRPLVDNKHINRISEKRCKQKPTLWPSLLEREGRVTRTDWNIVVERKGFFWGRGHCVEPVD